MYKHVSTPVYDCGKLMENQQQAVKKHFFFLMKTDICVEILTILFYIISFTYIIFFKDVMWNGCTGKRGNSLKCFCLPCLL